MRAVEDHLPTPFDTRNRKGKSRAAWQAPSQIWRTATLRMPERKNFDGLGFGGYAIIEMEMDAGKMNAADTGKPDVLGLRPDRWL
jgi:hypothetical protein